MESDEVSQPDGDEVPSFLAATSERRVSSSMGKGTWLSVAGLQEALIYLRLRPRCPV
jgi:hypothetical protein